MLKKSMLTSNAMPYAVLYLTVAGPHPLHGGYGYERNFMNTTISPGIPFWKLTEITETGAVEKTLSLLGLTEQFSFSSQRYYFRTEFFPGLFRLKSGKVLGELTGYGLMKGRNITPVYAEFPNGCIYNLTNFIEEGHHSDAIIEGGKTNFYNRAGQVVPIKLTPPPYRIHLRKSSRCLPALEGRAW